MIGKSAQKLDLYDFFSILLPGVAFLIGLVPFLPDSFSVATTSNAIIILLSGYIVGRALQPISVWIATDNLFPSHRETFNQELNAPRFHSPATIRQFFDECGVVFDVIDGDIDWLKQGVARMLSDDLYGLVRAYVHMDGRGRSRTFQAIYSFYRSMWFAFLSWGLLYFYYGAVKLVIGIPFASSLYTSKIGATGPDASYIGLGISGLCFLGSYVFLYSQTKYQEYYIQYLIDDFLILERVDNPDAIVRAEEPRQREN